jgi:hypothetical protein
MGNGMTTLLWASIPGKTYRAQYSQNLSGSSWMNLTPDVLATNSTATYTDFVQPAVQRFYRVQVLP